MPHATLVFLENLVVVIVTARVAADEDFGCVPQGQRVFNAASNDGVEYLGCLGNA